MTPYGELNEDKEQGAERTGTSIPEFGMGQRSCLEQATKTRKMGILEICGLLFLEMKTMQDALWYKRGYWGG
jgi:hypothetical protein